jgi:hypothetical protein
MNLPMEITDSAAQRSMSLPESEPAPGMDVWQFQLETSLETHGWQIVRRLWRGYWVWWIEGRPNVGVEMQ